MTPPAESGDAPRGATTDPTGRYVRQPNGRARPMSPFTQIWRWHVTMVASILFRAAIIALSGAAAITVGWLGALAFGPEAYACFTDIMGSPFGLIVAMGMSLVLFAFLLNGARHLINDTGAGLTLKASNLMSHIAVWGPLVLTAALWIGLFASGRVAL